VIPNRARCDVFARTLGDRRGLVLRPESLSRSGGCKSSPGCVLGRPDIVNIGAPCVLAMLDFRSPDHQGTSGTEH